MLLLMLAVIRPEGIFPGAGIPVGPLCLIAALAILPWRIYSTLGVANFWKTYHLPIILIALYQLFCTISLIHNIDRYNEMADFFRWGVVFIAGQMLLPLCIFIFLTPADETSPPPPFSLILLPLYGMGIALIPGSVLLQVYWPEVAPSYIQYFVGGDITKSEGPTRGILATSTDLGAISGSFTFFAAALAVQTFQKSHVKSALFTVCAIIFTLVGLLSASRNFILFIGIASLTIILTTTWTRNKVLAVLAFPVATTVVYFSAYAMPALLLSKLGVNIPHFENVSKGAETSFMDLLPRTSLTSLEERGALWDRAINLIFENPIFGVSNGAFRLDQDCSLTTYDYDCRHNAHNILLQGAIDAGIGGTIIIILLMAYIIKKSIHDKWLLAFTLGVIATLMVDNFTDHSYAWCVVTSFVGVMLSRQHLRKKC